MRCPGANLSAAELFGDANDVKAGTGGDGTWNLNSPVWSPRAAGIRVVLLAPPLFNTGLRWPNGFDAVANFGGTAGTVDLAGIIAAGGLRFATTTASCATARCSWPTTRPSMSTTA